MKWSTAQLLALALLSFGPLGCGGDDDGASDGDGDSDSDSDVDVDADADADADSDGDVDFNPGDYPDPPYGVVAGDIIENLRFVVPEQVDPAGLFELSEVYEDGKIALIFATAAWCYWCGVENEVLLQWDETYREDGLRIIGVIFEDEQYNPADGADAYEYWGPRGYGADYTYTADPYFSLGAFFDKAATPLNMFVDLETMEIMSVQLGWGEQAYREIIEAKLYPEE